MGTFVEVDKVPDHRAMLLAVGDLQVLGQSIDDQQPTAVLGSAGGIRPHLLQHGRINPRLASSTSIRQRGSRLFLPSAMFDQVASGIADMAKATRPLRGLDPASTLA
ncbi:hypothetical protein ETD83_08515 [Actinomadura soli]|uniref:Uncharacterized protein n=1 Tax=Actinomadura soli TaxID=2508997 RepID=A0A5C4JG55_9ACTN|nr:hypothetical protein [Actinomadura soli]TMR04301.1 hypothetical protein ETD83_08515 [Actinomadura soli]